MRIGIVSDTHNNLRNVGRIVEIFNWARVERVVHTGDITQAKTLRVLAGLDASLHGVYGNNDLERDSLESAATDLGFDFADGPRIFEWAECRLAVVHDPLDLDAGLLSECRVALHGHDHRRTIERRNGTLILNPGECAGHMVGYNAVAVLDLTHLETEILEF